MILPNVRLGLGREARKRARRQSTQTKNSTFAVKAAQFTLLVGGRFCSKAAQGNFRDRLAGRRRSIGCDGRAQSELSDAMRGYGQTNCSPERPKQNFLPTLTS
jgi:hypothetical protein